MYCVVQYIEAVTTVSQSSNWSTNRAYLGWWYWCYSGIVDGHVGTIYISEPDISQQATYYYYITILTVAQTERILSGTLVVHWQFIYQSWIYHNKPPLE